MKNNKTQDPIQDEEEPSELDKVKAELALMTVTAQRTMADFQNFKRRSEEERRELQVYANMKLLQSIFPAIDNLGRAFNAIPKELKENEWIKGIEAIDANLMTALENLGLEPINETGVAVDPHLHEVLMEANGPKGEIIQIFEKGYSFKGKTIRAAKVQVGNGK